MIAFDTEIVLLPHPRAPLAEHETPTALENFAIEIMRSDPASWSAEECDVLRQASFSDLWFFLKYVTGYSGPYTELTSTLHREMSNWYVHGMNEGEWNAGFVPRSSYKSTVWTHGAITWELLRNPDIRIGIFSCIQDRSEQFMHTVQRNFDSNDLMKFLFPEYCPEKIRSRDGTWNDTLAIMPNRSRNMPEPSLRAHTAGGSTQGIHVDVAYFDDIVGLNQLNSGKEASADMIRLSSWMASSLRTILISQRRSRVVVSATRYSIDDPYEPLMQDTKEQSGDWSVIETHYAKPSSEGRWRVYYRSAISDGESIFPESYDIPFLKRLAIDDPWTYITQYVNNPHSAGSLDFAGYAIQPAFVRRDVDRPTVSFLRNGIEVEVFLEHCFIALGADPAASEKRKSARTSRSAVAVVFRTPKDEIIVADVRRDYVKPSRFFSWLFDIYASYRGLMHLVVVETQGPFKLLESVLRDEMIRRKTSFPMRCIPAVGDKISSIRISLEPYLKSGKLYVATESIAVFRSEFDIFPSSSLDLMDATKIGINASRLPPDDEDEDEDEKKLSDFSKRHVSIIGY